MTTYYVPSAAAEQGAQLSFPFLDYERVPILFGFIMTPDPVLRARRQQALFAFPFLGEVLVQFREEIDGRQPLIEAVARRWRVSAAAIRRLRAFSTREIAGTGLALEEIARAFEIAARHVPDPGALNDFVNRALLVKELSDQIGIPVEELIRRASHLSAIPADRYALDADYDVHQPLEAIWKQILLPEAFHQAKLAGIGVAKQDLDALLSGVPQSILPVLGRAFYGAKGPAGILEVSEAWRTGAGYPLSTPGGEFALRMLLRLPSWEPLLKQPFKDGELQVESLSESQGLVTEGLALRHCIGRFALRCAYQGAHVLSVRTTSGFRLSTALLGHRGGGRFEVVEHRGYGNTCADPRAQATLAKTVQKLQTDLRPTDLLRLETARRRRMEAAGGEDEITSRLYPVYSSELREWWFRAYVAPHLPQPFRSSMLSLWLKAYGLREVAARLLPGLGDRPARAA